MAATVFTEVRHSLSSLIEQISLGEIGLPDIQRPFVWKNTKVRDLFDSMYRGFPVGYLLFWASGATGKVRHIGADSKQKVPRLLIVDGQQRLTSLYAVLKGIPVLRDDFTHEKISIAFRPRDARFEVADAAIRKDPEFIPDISDLWSGELHWSKFERQFIDRLRDRGALSSDAEEERIRDSIDQLKDLRTYPFTVLELATSVDEEQVAEVFVRINSAGATLSQADFILTLMSVHWDEGRYQLEDFSRAARQPGVGQASPYNHYIQPSPDQLLRVAIALGFRRARLQSVYSVLRGKDLETGEYSELLRDAQFDRLKGAQAEVLNLQNWHDFLKSLMRAGLKSGKMITSQTTLLYSYAMWLIGKHEFGVDPFELRNVIARWVFMAQLTGRYTGSYETTMEQDMARLVDIKDAAGFVRTLNQVVDDTLTGDFWQITMPNMLATSAAAGPAIAAYDAALNLLDARALLSKVRVSELLDPTHSAPKAAVERHHLFPKAYLKRSGFDTARQYNQVANFSWVEWATNIEISDDSPDEYWPNEVAAKDFSGKELADMMRWHALPDGWQDMMYEEFLEARRHLIAGVTREGFERLG